jgi:hypothetical protein
MCRDYRASSCSADLDKWLNIDLIKPQNKISEYLFYICRCFSGVRVAQYFCRSLFWRLHCLSFINVRLLIIPLVSSNLHSQSFLTAQTAQLKDNKHNTFFSMTSRYLTIVINLRHKVMRWFRVFYFGWFSMVSVIFMLQYKQNVGTLSLKI